MTRKEAAFGGFGWGCVGGVALVGLMYYAGVFLGLRPLPQLLNEPLLSLMPGFVFGFLIDTLQHAGKVVEELGLIILMVALLGALGAASAVAGLRWTSRYLPFACAAIRLLTARPGSCTWADSRSDRSTSPSPSSGRCLQRTSM